MTEYITEWYWDERRNAPNQDQREEIVRCRDCKHYIDGEMEYCHYCNKWCEQVESAGFCAWGERDA